MSNSGFPLILLLLLVLFMLAVGTVVVVLFIWIVSSRISKLHKELQRIASALGGRLEGKVVRLWYREREAQVSHWRSPAPMGKSGSVSKYLQIQTASSGNFHLTLSRQKDFWFDKIGLSEIKIGDPQFDQAFFINTDDAQLVSAFLLTDPHRQAVMALFDRQIDWITFDPGKITAVKTNYFPELNDPRLILGHLDLLYQLSA